MVRKEDRGKGKFDTLTKALELVTYTINITDNEKVFVPKHEKNNRKISIFSKRYSSSMQDSKQYKGNDKRRTDSKEKVAKSSNPGMRSFTIGNSDRKTLISSAIKKSKTLGKDGNRSKRANKRMARVRLK